MKRSAIIAACALSLACSRASGAMIMYSVGMPSVDVALSYKRETQERTIGTVSTTRETTTLAEKFDIRTGGWLYHPQFLRFSVALQPEFEQYESQHGSSMARERETTFFGFSLDANVLPDMPYNLSLHAQRNRKDIATNRAENDGALEYSLYRARLYALKHPLLPSIATLETRERLHDLFLTTRSERTDRFHVRSWHVTEASRTKIEAELQERETRSDNRSVAAEHASLMVDNDSRPGERSRSISRFRYLDRQTQAIGSTTTSLSSNLHVDHHEKLQSRYTFKFDDRQAQDSEFSSLFGSAWARHKLYESLTTTVRGDLEMREATDAELDRQRGAVRFDYTRPIPWGRLFGELGHERSHTDSRRLTTVGSAFQEPQELKGLDEGNRVRLGDNRTRIDIETVRVLDANGDPYCPEDKFLDQDGDCDGVAFADYVREKSGDFVYIWAIGGRLADDIDLAEGGVLPVWVDYEYEADPSFNLTQVTNTFGAGVDLWSMLRLYYRQSVSDIDLVSGIEPEKTEHSSQTVGAQLRLGRGPLRSITTFETQELEQAYLSKQTNRATQEITLRFRDWSWTDLWAELEDETADEILEGMELDDPPVRTQTQTQILRARQRFTFTDWSTTLLEVEDISVEGDLTERTRIPSTKLTLRQTFDIGGWSMTDIEAVDTKVKGDPEDFPPSTERADVTPTYTLSVRQRFTFRPTDRTWLGLGAHYNERERKDTGSRSEGQGLSSSLRWNIGPGSLSARMSYDLRGGDTYRTERSRLSARYEWRQGAWRPSLRYSLDDEERQALGGTGTTRVRKDSNLFFEVKRRF